MRPQERREDQEPGHLATRLLVVGSCTSLKRDDGCPHPLSLNDFRKADRLREREAALAAWRRPAGEMYTGRQHTQAVAGIAALRRRFGHEFAELAIVSAGYGLLREDAPIVPYNITFATMSGGDARAWARHLGVAAAVREACAGYPLVVFLLGSRYLDAVEPPLAAGGAQRFVFLARPAETTRLAGPGVTIVPAGAREATAYGAGLVALKGKMFRLFALGLARSDGALLEDVLRDDTPASFVRAMRLGLEGSPR